MLRALGTAGHGANILIADGNYPLEMRSYKGCTRVYLNLRPGQVPVTDVLQAVLTAVPIETAYVMPPPEGMEAAPIFKEFRELLRGTDGRGGDPEMVSMGRYAFYELAKKEDTVLAVATGEQRIYANILLTIGVRHA